MVTTHVTAAGTVGARALEADPLSAIRSCGNVVPTGYAIEILKGTSDSGTESYADATLTMISSYDPSGHVAGIGSLTDAVSDNKETRANTLS